MVQLFLHVLAEAGSVNTAAVEARKSLLKNVESVIKSIIKSAGRYEARLWLCSTVSSVHSLSCHDQRNLFLDILEMKNSRRDVAARLMRMIFDKKPKMVGSILAKNGHILEEFFRGNPKRIMQWFGHFAVTGDSIHKKGAKALSQFAFVKRDMCWEELEWKGKHGQSPAVVATKPHYFRDLDVLKTVENFLEYVPDFWSSDELGDSIKDGEILQIDAEYFVDQFLYLMYEENSKDAWHVVEDFLTDEQFSSLSQHLLIHLDEQRLLHFLKSLGKLISPTLQCKELTFSCCWLEVLLSAHRDHISLDDLVILNCVIAKGRQLWRLMNDEEHDEERGQIEELLKGTDSLTDADHFALMKEFMGTELPDALKWIGILSWNDAFSISHMSDTDDEDLTGSNHKRRKRHRRKKRRRYDSDEDKLDELLELGSSNGKNSVDSQRGSWHLSTDGFSASWDIADIPDHLSTYYFTVWVKWACFRWFSSQHG
ncbi:unnamed protein product [Urochloa humidicola]